jgi:DNA gyrase subunit A
MELGLVRRIDIDSEMQQAYLDYAMSVIVARALPDARDGLKPVHRRILYAMYDMGLRPDSPYKKSARIVGEVLGKYHPHGDMAVYEAMARMAQDFSMRCLLVDGQGNFGSVDGDPPAAMRYTEARLEAPALHMLSDIQKDTVDFEPNFDESLKEPTVLPSAIPNLLVNGATGIAVGMSTSIPPHNLGEVVDALKHILHNWERLDDIGLEDLMRFIQGPDFPTGGVILQDGGEDSLSAAYGTGRGRVTVQARAHLEEMERGRNRIIVNELPYMTNKSALIERIAELAREGKLEGLADLRDESDRQGMRIVIELTKTADPEAVLRDLYKHTPMQSTFSVIMLALVEGEPRLLTLKQALRVYLDHRLEIIRRRSQYDLEKARQRAHILEGLRVALKNLDEVIDLIRKAPDADSARTRLMKRFRLSELQAQAILDMQLRRLAALERKKIEDEYKEMLVLIKELEGLLRSPKKMRQVVADELQAVKEAYGDRRRTQIVHLEKGDEKKSLLTIVDLAPEKMSWLMVTPEGLLSRTLEDKLPRQSGSDAPAWLLRVNTRDTLYLACEQGETAAVPILAIPETDNPNDGLPYAKASALTDQHRLAALFTLPPKGERAEDWYVLTVTRQGMVKKTAVSELPGPSANAFTLVKVNEGDRLGWLRLTDGRAEVLLVTAFGMAIRFSEDEVRPMGLVAAGVMGIKLQAKDEVVGMEVLPQPGEILMLALDGSAKRVTVAQFPRQGRYGQGVVAWKQPSKAPVVGIAVGRGTTRVTLHLSKLAPKMVRLDEAPLRGRAASGSRLPDVRPGDQVLRLTVPWEVERPVTGAKGGDGAAPARRRKFVAAEVDQETEEIKSVAPAPAQKTRRKSREEPAITPKTRAKKTKTPEAAPKASSVPRVKKTIPPKTTPEPLPEKSAATEAAPTSRVKKATSSGTTSKTRVKKPAAAKAAPPSPATKAASAKTISKTRTKKSTTAKAAPPSPAKKTASARTTSKPPAKKSAGTRKPALSRAPSKTSSKPATAPKAAARKPTGSKTVSKNRSKPATAPKAAAKKPTSPKATSRRSSKPVTAPTAATRKPTSSKPASRTRKNKTTTHKK